MSGWDVFFLSAGIVLVQLGAVVVVVRPENMAYKNVVQKLGQRDGPTAFREAYFAERIEAARRFLQENFEDHYTESDLQYS